MEKLIIFSLVCIIGSCVSNINSNSLLDKLKKDVDTLNCHAGGYPKFVSLYFAKINGKAILQMVPFNGRPYNENTVFYYKQDKNYIYVCTGFCDEFRLNNGFMEWNDSLSNLYPYFLDYVFESDSSRNLYNNSCRNITDVYYEYKENKLIKLDSISMEDKSSIDLQAFRSGLKFHIGEIPEPSLP